MTDPIPPAPPQAAVPFPVYPVPPGAFGPALTGRREPERGLDGLLVAAWVLSMLGLAIVVVVLGLVAFAAAAVAADVGSDPPDLFAAAALGIGGALLIVAGLSAAGVRSIVLRRNLGEDRYRGPSLLALLAIWIVTSNIIAVPFLGDLMQAIEGGETESTPAFIALIITPLTLLVITVGFVLVPRTLPGVRLLEPRIGSAIWNFFLGVLIGAPAWLVGTALTIAISAILSESLGLAPDSAIPLELLNSIHPVLLVFALVVAAPVAEELFFRVVLFSAWEREYGYRRALVGCSLLFASIHLSLFAFAPFLLLAFVLGYVYARTRSYLTVIGIHATFNAISTVLLLTQSP